MGRRSKHAATAAVFPGTCGTLAAVRASAASGTRVISSAVIRREESSSRTRHPTPAHAHCDGMPANLITIRAVCRSARRARRVAGQEARARHADMLATPSQESDLGGPISLRNRQVRAYNLWVQTIAR